MRGRVAPLLPLRSNIQQQRPYICLRCLHSRRNPPLRQDPALKSHIPVRKDQSSWAQALQIAEHALNGTKTETTVAGISIDPLRIVAKELKFLTKNIQQLLGSGHPILDQVAKYYTHSEGKHIRPLLVLLMSRATASAPQARSSRSLEAASLVDQSLSPSRVLSDNNPSSPLSNPNTSQGDVSLQGGSDILPSQRRLAEITELIHTASLLHDDVIDISTSRRNSPSANMAFGNKMAVLAGDFLLGRASVALARLRNPEVIELLATVIANLVEGEFMQLKNTALDEAEPQYTDDTLSYYLQKTYLKSASLISKSCRAAALLGQTSPEIVEAAYSYGRNLGLAFQLVDDMLDYTSSAAELGKPAGADLELGLATAPLLFAWKDNQQLGVLVGRKFAAKGDVQMAKDLVAKSRGLEQTRALAQGYADKAASAIANFPDSEAKEGLLEMCEKAMTRKK